MKATKNINIYLIDKKPIKAIDVVQYDTGIQLVFTVKDFSIPSGATATLYVQKPSGRFVYQTDGITIAGDIITIDLENQALTEHGKVPYQVTITSGSDTVTSFAGLMLVERSLKDAGATESKTVIKAFDEVTADKLAELQTNAKTVIDALIATIPEDYTELTAKINESANAIKGNVSGAVVRVDDVSPVEHSPVVRVRGKNLIVYPYAETTTERSGVTFTVNNDGGISISGTSTLNTSFNISLRAQKNIPIKKGKTYVFTCKSQLTSTRGYAFLQIEANGITVSTVSVKNESVKFTATTDGYAVIGLVLLKGNTFDETVYIQLEEGNAATEYTPYVDPSTVTVTAGGKTYTPNADGTINGISSTVLADGISTDADGMTIECEYNKDTNKVISKLVNAIISMGGEVTI